MASNDADKKTSNKPFFHPGFYSNQRAIVAILLIACLAFGFLGGFLAADQKINDKTSSLSAQKQYISSEGDLISSIADNESKSVVSINVKSEGTARNILGMPSNVRQESAGSGFIVSADGIIATNRHVVDKNATNISVTLSDGTRYDSVDVIGRTNDNDSLDIAFLKIKDRKGKTLTPIKLGDSSKIKVGSKVIAIGNALGEFQNSVTYGIISGYGRNINAGSSAGGSDEALTNLFQTDAAINEGNSGGPLVNLDGEVIGINTAIAGNAQGIGFAIPINDVKGLISGVLAKGKLEKPYLGVRYVALTDDYAYQYNLSVKRGAYLAPSSLSGSPAVLPGSPAEKVGLQEKDVITKVNGMPIDERNSLTGLLGGYKVGDTVTLEVVRDGKTQQIKATLELQPQN